LGGGDFVFLEQEWVHMTLLGDTTGIPKGSQPFIGHFLQRQLEDEMSNSLGKCIHTYNLKVEASNLKELLR
jgi:hypothetical protein